MTIIKSRDALSEVGQELHTGTLPATLYVASDTDIPSPNIHFPGRRWEPPTPILSAIHSQRRYSHRSRSAPCSRHSDDSLAGGSVPGHRAHINGSSSKRACETEGDWLYRLLSSRHNVSLSAS